ncbi:MAG: ArsR/SmtB family transcription factor, partial [Halohasta sp.]
LPLKSRVEPAQDGANVISISEDAADEVFKTLSSSTARQILAALYEAPRPASELADETDTTVQNVRYHLENLQEAELIEPADTWYSEKGAEMTVYAPTEAALVVTASTESTADRLRSAITRLLGAVAVFGLASLVVQYVVTTYLRSDPVSGEPSGPGTMEDAEAEAADQAAETGFSLLEFVAEPGVIFFLGCLLALAVVVLLAARE